MSDTLIVPFFTLGAVLLLAALLGGKFKILGAEVADDISNIYIRVACFTIAILFILIALFPHEFTLKEGTVKVGLDTTYKPKPDTISPIETKKQKNSTTLSQEKKSNSSIPTSPIRKAELFKIAGFVVDSLETPLQKVKVSTNSFQGEVYTDENGSFEFLIPSNQPKGEYTIIFSKKGYMTLTEKYFEIPKIDIKEYLKAKN